jgi:hypothetical protein
MPILLLRFPLRNLLLFWWAYLYMLFIFSVLNAALCPGDSPWDPPPVCFGRLVSLSKSLCLSCSLMGAGVSSGQLVWCLHSQPLLLYGMSLRVQRWELSSLLHLWHLNSERWALCPSLILQDGFSVPPPRNVGVRLQFTVYSFQFCWGWDSVHPGVALDYFPRLER